MLDFIKAFDEEIEEVFSEVVGVKTDSERNKKLRKDIIRRFLSQVLTDDERAALNKLPVGCRMRENAKIISPERLSCGEYVWIGEGAMLDASGGLSIGSHTTIGGGVFIWTHHSILPNLLHENYAGSDKIVRKSTQIGSGCYIVGHAVVNPGVKIGDNVVVLPMSVVTTDVESNAIVCGAPARIVGRVDQEFIEKLKSDLSA